MSSAAERNRQPILEKLQQWFPRRGSVLEIGSGTGQHAVYFSEHLAGLVWQPTDREEYLGMLASAVAAANNPRILDPMRLDVTCDPWPGGLYDAAFSANTAHIMPWEAVVCMMSGVAAHLVDGGRFCLYGPFNIDGRYTAESNRVFDDSLKAKNPLMGVRDAGAVEAAANLHGMQLEERLPMPANNFMLVFKR